MFPWNGNFLEVCTIFPAWIGQDANSDITGDRIKVRDYEGVLFVCYKPAGTATDDMQFEAQQHTAASSGSSASLSFRNVAFNLGNTAITATQGWVLAHLDTAAATWDTGATSITPYFSNDSNFTVGTALTDCTGDTNAALFCIDVKASDLTSGTYDWFSINSEGDAIGNSLTTQAFYIPYGNKYGGRAPLAVEA